ncbi:MAG: metallophosphoesterase [Magnetococcus sp. YQC-5]
MKIIISIVILSGLVVLLLTHLNEAHDLEVTRSRIGQEKGKGPGLRMAQISDLHIVGDAEVEKKVLRVIQKEDPDLVLLTGDILPHRDKLEALDLFLTQLGSRSDKIAILGNWEYWAGMPKKEIQQFYARHQVTLLVNEAIVVGKEPGKQLLVAGLDDELRGTPNWSSSMAQHQEWNGPILILAHNPMAVELSPDFDHNRRDRVMLAGHTHGGQIRLFGWTIKAAGLEEGICIAGWCRRRGIPLYVSRGIGTSIIPVRIGSRPELALFEWIW